MWRRARGTTGVGGVEVEVEEEEEVSKVEEVEGEEEVLMTGDLQGEMIGEGEEEVMVGEMEVRSRVFHGTTTGTPLSFRWWWWLQR